MKAVPKPRVKLFTGTIEALDESAGTLTLKGPKGAMGFHAQEEAKDQLDGLNIGDKVIVKHIDGIALSIVKPRTNKRTPDWEEKNLQSDSRRKAIYFIYASPVPFECGPTLVRIIDDVHT